jgi:hypothetical protein
MCIFIDHNFKASKMNSTSSLQNASYSLAANKSAGRKPSDSSDIIGRLDSTEEKDLRSTTAILCSSRSPLYLLIAEIMTRRVSRRIGAT